MVMWKFAGFMLGSILCESAEEVKRQKLYKRIFYKVFVVSQLQINAD